MWKARNTVNSGVLATFGDWNAGVYAVFCPWQYKTPVNYSIVCLDECKKRWYLRVFSKNRRSWRERNLVNNSVLSFRGLKLWYLRGFLPSDSAKCCKLQHFVRCLCSIFKRAILSHVLGILQQEATSVARKKAGGRRREDSTQENMMMNAAGEELFHGRVYTQKLLRTEAFTQRSLYTDWLVHAEAFTHREIFTQRSFYARKLLHREVLH